jgi:hypothetical protein
MRCDTVVFVEVGLDGGGVEASRARHPRTMLERGVVASTEMPLLWIVRGSGGLWTRG